MSVPILTIKNNLQIGDQRRIAKELKCTYKTVYNVLNGKRGSGDRKTELQINIIQMAIKLGSLNAQKTQTLKPQEVEA